jgi:streptogramin lyase
MQHKSSRLCLGLILNVFLLANWFALPLSADTFVNRVGPGGAVRDVTLGDTSWTVAGSPYILEGHVTISAGSTLTVESGVTVQINAGRGIYVNGKIIAANATFTINGNGNWLGIYLSPASSDSVLDQCAISRAGADNLGYYNSAYRRTAIYVNNCGPTIVNCTISDTAGHGVDLWPNGGTILNNKFRNILDGWYAIVYDRVNNSPVVGGNTASGTGIAGIAVPGGTVTGTNRWNNPGTNFAYYLNGDLAIANGAKLIVDPGVTAKTVGSRLEVYGTLDAQGTAAEPIVFTSRNATPAAGDWHGIYFGGKAGDSVLSYVTVAYAGRDNLTYVHGAYRLAALYLDACSPKFDHLTVANSAWNGLEMWGSAATLSNVMVSNCGAHGLKAEAGSRPNVSNSSFTGNGKNGGGYYTIGTDASSVPDPVNVTFVTNRLQGVQIWGGTLAADAQWKNWATNAPYVVTADVTVEANVTLAIEQGATIKLQGCSLYVQGTLLANGDPDRISFTSWRDDSVGGDTNGDGDATTPANRNWKGIYLSPASGDSIFNNCLLRYGGGDNLGYIHAGYRYTTLYVDGAALTITNCTIANSGGHGIELWASSATIRNNLFENMLDGWYAIVYDSLGAFPSLAGNTVTGTGILGIALPEGTLKGTNQWHNPGTNFSYFLHRDLNVAEGAKLIIDPGVTVKTDGGQMNVYGTLDAQGTEASPIVFTSRNAKPKAGDWYGIYFGGKAGDSVLKHVKIEYAGRDNLGYIHSAYRYTSIYVDSCSPEFERLTVSDSLHNGIELYASNARFSQLLVSRCGRHGLRAEAGSRPDISNASFQGNGALGYYTIGTDASSVPNPVNVTFETNNYSGVQIWGGTLGADALWKNWATNAPYVITENLTVNSGVHLTIEPGTTVKVQQRGLYINGVLTADGSQGRINFTSWRDDALGGDSNGDGTNTVAVAGNWRGMYLSPASGESLLNNCLFRYAGGDNLGYIRGAYRYTTLFLDSSSPTITNCIIADSAGDGIVLWSSSPVIKDTQIINVGSGDYALVQNTLDCNPRLSGNTMSGTGIPGISIPGGTITTSVTWHKTSGEAAYYLNGELVVAEGITLSIEPGVTIRTAGQRVLVYGTLNAQGAEAAPIVFTSRNATPKPGNWLGIYFGPKAGESRLSYTTLSYAGGEALGYINSAWRYTSIYVDRSDLQFDHLTITNSLHNGLELYDSNAQFSHILISGCGRHGLRAEAGSRPSIRNASFQGNGALGYYTIGTDAASVPDPVNVTFETNSYSGVQIWGGALAADALWKSWATNAPYVITEDLTVNPGVRLTIEPGTTVKVQQRGLYINGVLTAIGDPAPIDFTSWRDDTAGGDSNGDGTNTVAAAGNWKGIYLSPASGASAFSRCGFRYAGMSSLGYFNNGYRYVTIYVDRSSPSFTNCVISNSENHGLELWSSAVSLQGNSFVNFGDNSYPILFDTLDTFPLMSSNSVSGAGQLGIAVPGGTIPVSGAWSKPGTNFPYLLNGDVSAAEGVILRLDPGVIVKSSGPGFYVSGSLIAIGTASESVVFTSRKATPAPGNWKGIYLGPKSGDSILSFCQIIYAGADSLGYFNSGYRRAALYLESCNPRLNNLTVALSAAYGLDAYAGSAVIQSSLIYSNAWSNFRLYGGATPTIVNDTIIRSGGVGIHCENASPAIVNNIIAFNDADGFRRDKGAPVLNNNCIFGNTRSNYYTWSPGLNDISVDPLFVDKAAGDYHLSTNSPCLNAGDNSVLKPSWMDLDGRVRLHEGQVDLGAYELGAPMAQHLVDSLLRNAGETAYIGEGVYTVDLQTKTQTAYAGTPAIYHLKVKYEGNLPDDLIVIGAGGSKGWAVKYFDSPAGANEISALITRGAWVVTNANPGAVVEFRVEVTPDKSIPGSAAKELFVTALAASESTRRDTVRLLTTNALRAQVDLLIRRTEDIRYMGDGIIHDSGFGQTKTQEVDQGDTVSYQFQVRNLGNITDNFLVRGPGGSGGWRVRYFDSLTGTNEVTAQVTGAGWTNITIPLNASWEFRAEVSAGRDTPGGSVHELLVTATSGADNAKSDTVKAVTTMTMPATTPQGGVYTLDADFEKGTLVGLEYQTVHDQLQLSREAITLPFIWVPNSNEGTVSKVDTRTGRELGRYRTSPSAGLGSNSQPSRTTVDQQGNCWVANRQNGTVVKIGLYENGQYMDRNGNGIIETSQDLNGDGDITGSELLPWGKDECVLYEIVLIPGFEETFTPGTYANAYVNDYWNPGPRGIAVDAKGNVWAGTYTTKKFYYLDGATAQILQTNDVNYTVYGALIDANGVLWGAGQNQVLRFDPASNSITNIELGHMAYGLGLDRSNHLFVAGWTGVRLSRINVVTGVKEWTVPGINESRGVAVTDDGDVWVANSAPGTVARWSNDGVLKTTIAVGSAPTGVSVDAAGKVWVVNNGDEYIKRIDPATDAVDLSKRIVGGTHYGYSDMTGIIARTATTRFGRWTVIHNSKLHETPWGTVSWHSFDPTGTSVKVRARSSDDQKVWSLWEKVINGVPLNSTPPGKYLQVEVTLQVTSGEVSPILYDLTIVPAGEAVLGEQVYRNDFQTGAGPEWSHTNLDLTPVGERQFLGQFGNDTVTLTLNNLPPHAAVSVLFDLFVIRSWDGNNTNNNDGPDLWELNVAGGRKLLYTTFNNGPTNDPPDAQAYPDLYPDGKHPARTGASENNTLGFSFANLGVMDAVYRLGYTFPHSANELVLNFAASGLTPDLANESWGLDNVRVYLTPLAEPARLVALGKTRDGQFLFRLWGEPEQSYTIEASTNLFNWVSISTNTIVTNAVDLVDQDAPNFKRRFYRAVSKQ